MDHHVLYEHILRDLTFINLIFKEHLLNEDDLKTIKTRVSELLDMTMTSSFKHLPHASREFLMNEIYKMDVSWRSIESVEDFEEHRPHLKGRISFILSKLKEIPKQAA